MKAVHLPLDEEEDYLEVRNFWREYLGVGSAVTILVVLIVVGATVFGLKWGLM